MQLRIDIISRARFAFGLTINHGMHGYRPNGEVYEDALPACPTKHICPKCGLVCESAGGLTRHSKIHKDVPQMVTSNNGKFKCHICEHTCKTVLG